MELVAGLGLVGILLTLFVGLMLFFMPLFVWGIYNSNKRQEEILKKLIIYYLKNFQKKQNKT